MGIHESTRVQAYQLKPGGVRARMAILRMIAAESANNANPSTRLQPGDWRGARHWTLKGYESAYAFLSQGANGKTPIWYSHQAPDFRDERDCHDIIRAHYGRMHHTGWFTDANGDETAIGIVCRLTHGRFIAGYRWTSNDERVYFGEVFTDDVDAAQMADEHARVFAESEREHSERFRAMSDAESHAESVESDVRNAFAARNVSSYWRQHCRDRIEELRAARADVVKKTAAYERG